MSLFDATQDVTEEAIARAEQNAAADWQAAARHAVERCAHFKPEFTSDDVWDVLSTRPEFTHDNRALGAIMRRAASDGLIAKTDRTQPSRRTECHGRDVRIWRAL